MTCHPDVAAGRLAGAGPAPRRPGRRPGRCADRGRRGSRGVELIAIEPPADTGALDLAVLALSRGDHDWVGFTSVNAVDAVLGRARDLAVTPVVSADTRVAAVGPATAAALRAAGLPVDLMPPSRGSAAALAEVWPRAGGDQSVLLPRSDLAPPTLPDAVAAKGYRVRTVVAYRTVVHAPAPQVADRFAAGDFHAVLFTSPSTVQALHGVVDSGGHGAGRDRRAHPGRGHRGGSRDPLHRTRTRQPRVCRCSHFVCPHHAGGLMYPTVRPRRLRRTAPIRRLVAETRLHPADLVLPLFVKESLTEPAPLSSMPGVLQHTRDSLRKRGRGGSRRPGSAG